MDEIYVEVDGKIEHLESIWAHLQMADRTSYVYYKIRIPIIYLEDVFDPYRTRDKEESWEEFIEKKIEDLGTFIVEGYLKTMKSIISQNSLACKRENVIKRFYRQLLPKPKTYYRWVIATVDKIFMKDRYCELFGRAVPFQPTS